MMLTQSFFNRSALAVTHDLLGKQLVRQVGQHTITLMITEVEAYDGPDDLACHARFGNTQRTAPMFGPAGHWYVYLIYGMHWMLNIVTGPIGYPAAILIRGADQLTGPGKLTKHLCIDKTCNAQSATSTTGLWIADAGINIKPKNIICTPRIGIAYAGPVWSQVPYRFVLKQ